MTGTHKHAGKGEYWSWGHMIQRCTNPKNADYARYGGRGVTVCERWRWSFDAFLSDMGRRPSADLSLDRIDNDGNYEPGNVRWATRKEQARNTKNAKKITVNGQARTVAEWAEIMGYARPQVIHCRIYSGWPVDQAVLGR